MTTAYGLSPAAADLALTAAIANWVYAQLHTDDPGSSGTANISSTTVREGITWGSPDSATVSASNTPTWPSWDGDNDETEEYITGWSESTGTSAWGGTMALSASVTMDTGDTLELEAISITIPAPS